MDRCSQCSGNTCLPADGPRGDCLFVGEAPGKDENKGFPSRGISPRVFIGKTGRELDEHYLPLAGLRRSQVRIINAIACMPNSPGGKLDPKKTAHQKLLRSCAETHLYPELANHPPRVIVPMGAFACKAIDPDINLELQHGIPVMTRWGIPAFPMYHPALGMHSPKQMLYIRTDWIRLRAYLRGALPLRYDNYPEVDYAEVTHPAEIRAINPHLPLACDTESSRAHGPYFLTYSQQSGMGRLIRASRRDLLDAFQSALTLQAAPILFHNWLYDARIVADMGLRYPSRLIRDTMLLVYHLGNLPQGLKALAYRELGMAMQDFEDLVKPHSIPRVLDYYRLAQEVTWFKPEAGLERDSKTGLWKVYAPQSMNTKLRRFFTDYGKNDEKDVFGMWEDNWTDSQAMIEEKLGISWPGMDIAHVPFEEALFYACRDSDALIRLWPIIREMATRVHDFPQEHWRAA